MRSYQPKGLWNTVKYCVAAGLAAVSASCTSDSRIAAVYSSDGPIVGYGLKGSNGQSRDTDLSFYARGKDEDFEGNLSLYEKVDDRFDVLSYGLNGSRKEESTDSQEKTTTEFDGSINFPINYEQGADYVSVNINGKSHEEKTETSEADITVKTSKKITGGDVDINYIPSDGIFKLMAGYGKEKQEITNKVETPYGEATNEFESESKRLSLGGELSTKYNDNNASFVRGNISVTYGDDLETKVDGELSFCRFLDTKRVVGADLTFEDEKIKGAFYFTNTSFDNIGAFRSLKRKENLSKLVEDLKRNLNSDFNSDGRVNSLIVSFDDGVKIGLSGAKIKSLPKSNIGIIYQIDFNGEEVGGFLGVICKY